MNALVARRAIIIEAESGARLIGSGGDPCTRELREFLTRNRVPHRFIDIDRDRPRPPRPRDGRPLAGGRPADAGQRREGAARADDPRGGQRAQPARPEQDRESRLGLPDHRRRAGRPRRRRLRGDRGARDDPRRRGRARRPGEHLLADRELPRLPGGHLRLRPGRAGDRPGAPLRPAHRGARAGPAPAHRGRPLRGRARQRRRAGGAHRRPRHRGELPAAAGRRLRAAERRGRLLRGDAGRGADVRRRVGGRGRRRQLGRAGGDLPLRHGRARLAAAARRRPRRLDVELPGRADRGDRQHRRAPPPPRSATSTASATLGGIVVEETTRRRAPPSCRSAASSSSSAPIPAPSGSTAPWPRTTTASC